MAVAHPHKILAAYSVGRLVATPASSQPSSRGRLEPKISQRRPMYLDSGTVMNGPGVAILLKRHFCQPMLTTPGQRTCQCLFGLPISSFVSFRHLGTVFIYVPNQKFNLLSLNRHRYRRITLTYKLKLSSRYNCCRNKVILDIGCTMERDQSLYIGT